MHICVGKLTIIVSEWLFAWTAPSHYLNQCWNIVKWTLRNKLQWNFDRNSYIFVTQNAFEKCCLRNGFQMLKISVHDMSLKISSLRRRVARCMVYRWKTNSSLTMCGLWVKRLQWNWFMIMLLSCHDVKTRSRGLDGISGIDKRILSGTQSVNTINSLSIALRPEQNSWHFADDVCTGISKWNSSYFDSNFAEVCSQVSDWPDVNIGPGNGLAPRRPS